MTAPREDGADRISGVEKSPLARARSSPASRSCCSSASPSKEQADEQQDRDAERPARALGGLFSTPEIRSAPSWRGAVIPTQPPEGDEVDGSIATDFDRPRASTLGRQTIGESFEHGLERIDPAMIGLFFFVLASASTTSAIRRGAASTTTSCGRPTRSCTAVSGSRSRSPTGRTRTAISRTSCRCPGRPASPSYALLPFPPLPAILLMPFVAIFGLATNSQLFGVLPWRDQRRAGVAHDDAPDRAAAASRHWRRSSSASARSPGTRRCSSTTWFLAHVVALTFTLLGSPSRSTASVANSRGARGRGRRGRGERLEPDRCRVRGQEHVPELVPPRAARASSLSSSWPASSSASLLSRG